MKYQLTQSRETIRTPAYVGTVETTDDADLLALKENIKRHNARIRAQYRETGLSFYKLKRVRIQGRGPRAVHAKAEGRYARSYDSHLPKALATHWDVYVNEDTEGEYNLRY